MGRMIKLRLNTAMVATFPRVSSTQIINHFEKNLCISYFEVLNHDQLVYYIYKYIYYYDYLL